MGTGDLTCIGLQLAKNHTVVVDRSNEMAFDQRVETGARVEDGGGICVLWDSYPYIGNL